MTTVESDKKMFGVEGLARSFIVGAVVGGVGTFAVMLAITYNATSQWAPALAVAAYTACWGGPGFGGMLGAVSAMTRQEHRDAAAASAQPDVGRLVLGDVVPASSGVSSAA